MKYTALWRGEKQKRLTGFVAQMPPARQPHLGHGDIRGRGGHVCVGISAGGEGERVQIDAFDQQPCRSKCSIGSGGGGGVFWMKSPQSECINNPLYNVARNEGDKICFVFPSKGDGVGIAVAGGGRYTFYYSAFGKDPLAGRGGELVNLQFGHAERPAQC